MATDITQFKSIKDVPEDQIFQKSTDNKVLLLRDGTKVSDALIAQAKQEVKAKAAGAAAAQAAVENGMSRAEIVTLVEETVRRVLAEEGKAQK
ncbi:MAG TPA: hypothetical protein VJ464_15875 [Blastocatellia bacterium]|nr:hypothetical protein [Blastocatellia bacterium]